MRVKISESAHHDLECGFRFYESQEIGVGQYFIDTMYSELESLCLFAGIHNKKFGFYRMLTRKFPYSVYYRISEDVVQIWRILDNRRNPKWIEDQLT